MSQIFFILLGFIATIPIIFILLFAPFVLGASLSSQLLGTHVAERNLKIYKIVICFLLLLSLIAFLLSSSRQLFAVLPLVLSAIIVFTILSYFPNKFRAGNILLKVKFTTNHKVLLSFGFTIILFSVLTLIASYKNEEVISQPELSTLFMNYLLGTLFFIQGLTSIQLSEHGIFWLHFTKWESIQDYYWEPDKQTTLTLTKKGLFGFRDEISFSIPTKDKSEVEKIISERLLDQKRANKACT